MPRRRLNPYFLPVAASVLVAAGGGAVAWRKFKPKDATKLSNAGDMYYGRGDLVDAAAAYNAAAAARPTDAHVHVQLGRIYYQLRDQDFASNFTAAVAEWTRAAELQPDLAAAWQGLLEANMLAAMNTAQHASDLQDQTAVLPERFAEARDAAAHLQQIDPANAAARAAIPILTINLWLSRLSIPLTAAERRLPVDQQPTDAQRIDHAVAELRAVLKDHPENPDLPFWIARADIGQAQRLTQQLTVDPGIPAGGGDDAGGGGGGGTGDRAADARALLADAATVFDAPIARQPHNAQLYYRKFEVLTALMLNDRSPTAVVQYQRQQQSALEHAQAEVKPADGLLFAAYKTRWADYLAMTDPAAAEAAYKLLLDRPAGPAAGPGAVPPVQRVLEDLHVRLQYALMLERDPTRRADALKVLDGVPTAVPGDVPAAARPGVAGLVAQGRLQREGVLIDLYETDPNRTDKAGLAKRAAAEIDAVAADPRYAGEADVLKARGRLSLVTRQYRDAVQQLQAAADRLAATGRPVDYEMLGWQATALVGGGQSGEAIKLLQKAVADPAGANAARPHELLAKLFLQDQDYDHARPQVAWLSERYPDVPETIHLQILALGHDADPKAVAALYDRLPERTPTQQLDKAAWAVNTANPADAERIYADVLRARPGDPATSVRLARLYAADDAKGRANVVLQAAQDAHPDDRAGLQLVKDQINGASQSALADEAYAQIMTFKDPLTRYVALYHLAASRNQPLQEVDALEHATAIQADNHQLLSDLFLRYLAAKQFDKAGAMLPHLAAIDADSAHGSLYRFRLAMAQGELPKAVAVGRQLVHDYPQFASSFVSLGQAEQASGQLGPAGEQYAAALDRQGNDPDTIQRLVDCQIRLGKLTEARRVLTDARRKYPDDRVYRQQLVQLEVAYGDPEAVLPVVDEALAAHPDVAENWQTAVQAYAAAAQRRTARADAAGAAGFTAHARSLLSDAVKRWPDNPTLVTELADLEAHDGTDAGLAAAADTFGAMAATDRWHNRPLPDVLLGRMYLAADRPALAEAPFRRAVGLAPDLVPARTGLADALFAVGKADDALAALAPAKDQPDVRAKDVDLLLALHRGPQAEAEVSADLKANPTDPAAANLLAHVYAAQGKWDQAAAASDRAIASDPKNLAIYFVRGTTELDRPAPDPAAAARDLAIFRSAYPDDLQGRLALAQALTATGEPEGATAELEAAVALAPDEKGPRLRLAQAYLAVDPIRGLDAERVIGQALTLPRYAHDPEVQRVAALVYLGQGEDDRAVAAIRDAVAHSADQRPLLNDYLSVLLATKHYDLVLAESAKVVDDPKTAWSVFDDRGRAKAATGDPAGAAAEFTTALDRAGAAPTLGPSVAVADHATASLGIDAAAALVEPRSRNSAGWKAVLAHCYAQVNDRGRALALAKQAQAAVGTFDPADRLFVTRQTATLCMGVDPPQSGTALPLFQSVLERVPDDRDALNNVACILAEQATPPDPKAALAYSTRAYELVRRAGQVNPFVFDTQGWLLILNGQVDEGIDVLRQVADRADFPDAHYHLAEGYLRKRLPDEAKRELAAATTVYQSAVAAHRAVDQTLGGKIAAATAEADRMARGGGDPPSDKPVARDGT